MKTFKGTKGEWKIENNVIYQLLKNQRSEPRICKVSDCHEIGYSEMEANAKLIASAPTMKDDIIDLIWLVEKGATPEEINERILNCKTTINKAL